MLLSERYSNINFGQDAKGRATAVNPLLLSDIFNNSHNIIRETPTSQEPNPRLSRTEMAEQSAGTSSSLWLLMSLLMISSFPDR